MPDRERMQRVNKKTPCPVCGKPDWCLIAPDKTAAICQRIQEGSVKRCGNAGWLHILVRKDANFRGLNRHKAGIPVNFDQEKDFGGFAALYRQQISKERLHHLSEQLGVSAESLSRLSIGWDGKAYTFPMKSGYTGKIIGIRRRFPNGQKFTLTRSKTGLFIPADLPPAESLCLICEGPTDTAAALDLGFSAIGRPNCNSLIQMTASAVAGCKEVVIAADNDAAGKDGAEKLSNYLAVRCRKVKVVCPPAGIKDLRQWLQRGLTADCLKQIIEKTEIVTVQIRAKD